MAGASGGAPARDLVGRKLGRYEVLAQLAAGGMATVYVARAQGVAGFERLVAIKVLHPHLAHDDEFISMFLDEARLAARIRHPNVVPTLDISDSAG
jgi:serine/threonine protein kinase